MKYGKLLMSFIGLSAGLSVSAQSTENLSAETLIEPEKRNTTMSCDSDTRFFVLLEDDPLLKCSLDSNLSETDRLQCKKITMCMIEEGIFVGEDYLARFSDSIGGDTVQTLCPIPALCPPEPNDPK